MKFTISSKLGKKYLDGTRFYTKKELASILGVKEVRLGAYGIFVVE